MGYVFNLFDLKFFSQNIIKAQALTEQLVDATSPLALPNNDSFPNDNVSMIERDTWELYFDSSKHRTGSEVEVIITPPMGEPILLSYHLNFLCTNNTIEYEVLIVGLCIALTLGAQNIKIFSDSQLVIKQINGMYQAKHENYKNTDLTINLLENFNSYTIANIP